MKERELERIHQIQIAEQEREQLLEAMKRYKEDEIEKEKQKKGYQRFCSLGSFSD